MPAESRSSNNDDDDVLLLLLLLHNSQLCGCGGLFAVDQTGRGFGGALNFKLNCTAKT